MASAIWSLLAMIALGATLPSNSTEAAARPEAKLKSPCANKPSHDSPAAAMELRHPAIRQPLSS